jgi:molybdopterin converting factor small subunit
LRHHTDGRDTIEASGETVGALLNDATARFPGLKDRLFEGGELRRFVNVYVNNEDIRYLDDLDTKVTESDEVSIIPAIAGG